MEDIKKLLEDWQKTLNMVINSKLAIVDIDTNHMELASQEAMGDFSKPPLRDSSDTDSDISWYPNAFRNSPYCFQVKYLYYEITILHNSNTCYLLPIRRKHKFQKTTIRRSIYALVANS